MFLLGCVSARIHPRRNVSLSAGTLITSCRPPLLNRWPRPPLKALSLRIEVVRGGLSLALLFKSSGLISCRFLGLIIRTSQHKVFAIWLPTPRQMIKQQDKLLAGWLRCVQQISIS